MLYTIVYYELKNLLHPSHWTISTVVTSHKTSGKIHLFCMNVGKILSRRLIGMLNLVITVNTVEIGPMIRNGDIRGDMMEVRSVGVYNNEKYKISLKLAKLSSRLQQACVFPLCK